MLLLFYVIQFFYRVHYNMLKHTIYMKISHETAISAAAADNHNFFFYCSPRSLIPRDEHFLYFYKYIYLYIIYICIIFFFSPSVRCARLIVSRRRYRNTIIRFLFLCYHNNIIIIIIFLGIGRSSGARIVNIYILHIYIYTYTRIMYHY